MSLEGLPLPPEHDAFDVPHVTLTPEQAAQINDSFDITLYAGAHGIVDDKQHGAEDADGTARALLDMPTSQEYDEAASVIARLRPGDTLYTEGYGFSEQPPHPEDVPLSALSLSAHGEMTSLKRLALQLAAMNSLIQNHEAIRAEIEGMRSRQEISAWDYARELAELKGVRLVIADHDANDEAALKAMTGGKELLDLMRSPDAEDRALAKRVHAQRELRVPDTVLADALDQLSTRTAPPTPGAPKPQLAILWGDAHKEKVAQIFHDEGVPINVHNLQMTSTPERAIEVSDRYGAAAVRSSIFDAPYPGKDFPDTSHSQRE